MGSADRVGLLPCRESPVRKELGRIQNSKLSEIPSTPTLGIASVVEDHLYKLKSCGQNFSIKLGSNCSNENQPFLAWAVYETTQFLNLTAFILYPTHVVIHSPSRGITFPHAIFPLVICNRKVLYKAAIRYADTLVSSWSLGS